LVYSRAINNVAAFQDVRVLVERVRVRLSGLNDVEYGDPARQERVGEEISVTAPGDRLRAHHRLNRRCSMLDDPADSRAIFRRVHVIGVPSKLRVPPGDVA
jgi:hypothetical protein